MTPEQNKLRSELMLAVKHRQFELADELRRQLKASRLADHIKKTVDSAPTLTKEQLDKLSLLLRRGDAA